MYHMELIGDGNLIFWVFGIPLGDQFVAGFADVFAVDDRAGENTRDVQPICECGIGAVLQIERAIKTDVGRISA